VVAALVRDRRQPVELEVEGGEFFDERRRLRLVHELGGATMHREPVDQEPGHRGFLAGGRFGGAGCKEIGDAQAAVGGDARHDSRTRKNDLAEPEGPAEDPGDLEVDRQSIEMDEVGAVAVREVEAFDDGGQGERIEANARDLRLAVKQRA
jgi:hypothetical protein